MPRRSRRAPLMGPLMELPAPRQLTELARTPLTPTLMSLAEVLSMLSPEPLARGLNSVGRAQFLASRPISSQRVSCTLQRQHDTRAASASLVRRGRTRHAVIERICRLQMMLQGRKVLAAEALHVGRNFAAVSAALEQS